MARDRREWISVKDSLPEIGTEVNVYCPDSRIKVKALARYIRYEGAIEYYWDNAYGGHRTHVQNAITYWMPLPEWHRNC